MAYVAFAATEIAVDKPITNELMTKMKDNFDYLYGQISNIGEGLINGSFEVDSLSAGVPDSWDVSEYAGGDATLSTVFPSHGQRCLKFTQTTGAALGGGQALSDFIPISSAHAYMYTFDLLTTATAGNLSNKLVIEYYKQDQASLSNATLHDTTGVGVAPSTGWIGFTYIANPPTSARYAKICVIGGTTTLAQTTANSIYFDNVAMTELANYSYGTVYTIQSIAIGATGVNCWRARRSGRVAFEVVGNIPDGAGAGLGYTIYANGSAVMTTGSLTTSRLSTYHPIEVKAGQYVGVQTTGVSGGAAASITIYSNAALGS